jgi:hypothetical protein
MMRVQSLDRPLGDALEEASHAEIGHHQHHREEQDNGGEVDGLKGLLRTDNAKGHHQDRANDGRARPIDLHPRKFPEREHEIAAEEDQIGREHARI